MNIRSRKSILPGLTSDFIRTAIRKRTWDFGNNILYEMCARNRTHKRDDVIIAKIWLIGRAYSAAIERRRRSKIRNDGDQFYEKKVAPKIRLSPIDTWFRRLAADESKSAALSLKIHKKLIRLFSDISGLKKRSLASKYLHFHFPDRFYIYDSRAQAALGKLVRRKKSSHASLGGDRTYARFFGNCEMLTAEIQASFDLALTPRQLDKVLLAFSAFLG